MQITCIYDIPLSELAFRTLDESAFEFLLSNNSLTHLTSQSSSRYFEVEFNVFIRSRAFLVITLACEANSFFTVMYFIYAGYPLDNYCAHNGDLSEYACVEHMMLPLVSYLHCLTFLIYSLLLSAVLARGDHSASDDIV